MAQTADVIICGAGQNSLCAAAYAAKAGLDVLILEKNDMVGGGAVSREIPGAPGFVSNPHAQGVLLMAANPIITHDELELMSRFGLEITEFDNMYATQFEDGTHIMQWCDIDRTCASIARFSEQDADTYRKFANMSLRLLPRETK